MVSVASAVIHVLGAVVETMSAEGITGLGVFNDGMGFVLSDTATTQLWSVICGYRRTR